MTRLAHLIGLIFICLATVSLAQGSNDWTGEWDTYWRDGEARMTLRQEADSVRGTYTPGDGQIEGQIEGRVLRGLWRQDGTDGPVVFALSEDGQTFTGRFTGGEYWNGRRVTAAALRAEEVLAPANPREVLRRLVDLGNATVYGADIAAVSAFDRLLFYAGETAGVREERRRRQLLWTLIDLSTFRIYDAPRNVEGGTAEFRIGPAATNYDYVLQFKKLDQAWYMVVPAEADLQSDLDGMIAALGYPTLTALNAARADSPRSAIRDFLSGARIWEEGGAEKALARLDLSFVPERFYGFEAPLLAQYLKQVIDRAGFVTWQEIPDDPDRSLAYVFYRHPVGSVVIDRVAQPDGEGEIWAFTVETMRTAPDLFAAMQDLPISDAIPDAEPITHFFELREKIRTVAPGFLHRIGPLDVWQWLSLPVFILSAILIGWLGGAALSRLLSVSLRRAERGVRVAAARRLGRPAGLALGSGLAIAALLWVGLAQTVLGPFAIFLAILTTVAFGWFCYILAEVVGSYFLRRAERTPGFVDEIATSLIFGVLKVAVVAMSIIAIADVSGLPYEGVIAGLGVGGVALAFAARETVSNLISGAILMSDRPFHRGDLIEADGKLASVERVGLRSTRLRTLDDEGVIIPNSQLTDKAIVNWGQRRKRSVRVEIGLTFDTPREKLDAFVVRLRTLYLEQPSADQNTAYVGLKSISSSSLEVELWGYFNVPDYPAQVEAKHRLIADIVDLARDLEVELAFPTRTIVFASSATVTRSVNSKATKLIEN
ncbi:mechanosensitive ion channel family protein [Sulfitobacter sp. HNIBRBA3233]|uniref:mechanosensitive ion channel family protein n=1 Tax=Sulfitobacter marinivivus TaxID=3158558 RepID=UPI0032DFF908